MPRNFIDLIGELNLIAVRREELETMRRQIDDQLTILRKGEAETIRQLQAISDGNTSQSKIRKQQEGFVYVLKAHDNLYKIGHSADPNDRQRTFNVKLPFPVEFDLLIPVSNMRELERALHKHFEHKAVNGEWFKLSTDDIDEIKSRFIVLQPNMPEVEQNIRQIDGDYKKAIELVRRINKASISLLQVRMRIGYTRAAQFIQQMEDEGIVGPQLEARKPRPVLPIENRDGLF